MLLENMAMAFSALKANRMRSFLTMLGIIIGIGSVIAIVSIGDTMRSVFSSLYEDIGVTQAYISVGYWLEDVRESDFYTMEDVKRIKEIFGDEIAYADNALSLTGDAIYGRMKMKFEYTAADANYIEVQPVEIVYGRYLNEADVKGRKYNTVVDIESARTFFGEENAVGKTFRSTIDGEVVEFYVVGVYSKEYNALQKMLMGVSSENGRAIVPSTLASSPDDDYYSLRLFASKDVNLDDFYARLLDYLARTKDRNPNDFYIERADSEMSDTDSIMNGLAVAVGGIAAISLLVGGIGIMNIMLVSVTERTREIGIRKSLGARTRDIMVQFLTESAILSACGGTIGIMVGSGIVLVGSSLFDVAAVIKPQVVILAVGFSALVGLFFGIYPASKAAKKDPIEALRYE